MEEASLLLSGRARPLQSILPPFRQVYSRILSSHHWKLLLQQTKITAAAATVTATAATILGRATHRCCEDRSRIRTMLACGRGTGRVPKSASAQLRWRTKQRECVSTTTMSKVQRCVLQAWERGFTFGGAQNKEWPPKGGERAKTVRKILSVALFP